MKFIFIILILFFVKEKSFSQEKMCGKSTSILEKEYNNRIIKFAIDTSYLTKIEYNKNISFNAIYKSDTIFIGQSLLTNPFFTLEDKMSIIYHECIHRLCSKSNKFPCKVDKFGNIFQIKTETLILKPISKAEIKQDSVLLLNNEMSEQEKALLLETIKKENYVIFIYAPSNLSREEIFCYQQELNAFKKGIFNLSVDYINLIEARIEYEKILLEKRIKYEKKQNLNEAGFKVK